MSWMSHADQDQKPQAPSPAPKDCATDWCTAPSIAVPADGTAAQIDRLWSQAPEGRRGAMTVTDTIYDGDDLVVLGHAPGLGKAGSELTAFFTDSAVPIKSAELVGENQFRVVMGPSTGTALVGLLALKSSEGHTAGFMLSLQVKTPLTKSDFGGRATSLAVEGALIKNMLTSIHNKRAAAMTLLEGESKNVLPVEERVLKSLLRIGVDVLVGALTGGLGVGVAEKAMHEKGKKPDEATEEVVKTFVEEVASHVIKYGVDKWMEESKAKATVGSYGLMLTIPGALFASGTLELEDRNTALIDNVDTVLVAQARDSESTDPGSGYEALVAVREALQQIDASALAAQYQANVSAYATLMARTDLGQSSPMGKQQKQDAGVDLGTVTQTVTVGGMNVMPDEPSARGVLGIEVDVDDDSDSIQIEEAKISGFASDDFAANLSNVPIWNMRVPIEVRYGGSHTRDDWFVAARNEQNAFFGTFGKEFLRPLAATSDAEVSRDIFSKIDTQRVKVERD